MVAAIPEFPSPLVFTPGASVGRCNGGLLQASALRSYPSQSCESITARSRSWRWAEKTGIWLGYGRLVHALDRAGGRRFVPNSAQNRIWLTNFPLFGFLGGRFPAELFSPPASSRRFEPQTVPSASGKFVSQMRF